MSSLRLATFVATVAGFGDRVPAPGTTVGSLPPAVAWWIAATLLVPHAHRDVVTAVATAIVVLLGVWASDVEARRRGSTDPRPIVIDEVAGQWLCLLLATLLLPPLDSTGLAVVAVFGFLSFRFFDVVKPWPVNAAERLPGGIGIVADDLVAGTYSGLLVGLLGQHVV
jgi:phosphatidylglycerophosphatase A